MAAQVFNIMKGRAKEIYNRVKSNDPANSAFIIVILASAGLESDATLLDKDDLAALVSGTTNEATNSGYARKTLDDSALAALPAPDDTNDRNEFDLPDQNWATVATGDVWAKLVLCYDPDTTGGADSAIIPVCLYDFAITPNGGPIDAIVNASGAFRAA